MDRALGRRLHAARIEAGIETQEQLGQLVGISARQVRNYEAGRVTRFSAEVIQKWASATGKPLEYFLPPEPNGRANGRPSVRHPGIEALLKAPALAEAAGLDPQFLRAHRDLYIPGPDGDPLIVETIEDALDLLRPMQRWWQRAAKRA